MQARLTSTKFKVWLRHYVVAEVLGTIVALAFAYSTFQHDHSYVLAAGAGFLGEGIGFYGYVICRELRINGRRYRQLPLFRRFIAIASKSSANLLVEFAPAEIIDNIFIRPFLMYYVPLHIHPYPLGFVVGKFSADIFFYVFAIIGYEAKRKFL